MRFLIKVISLLMFSVTLCGYIITPVIVPELYLTSSQFGPFFSYQKDYELKVTVHSSINRRTFNSEFFCGNTPEDILYHKDYGQNTTEGGLCELTYKIPTHDYLSENGLFCCIYLHNDVAGIYNDSYSFTIYPLIKNKSINASNYKKKTFIVENIAYELTPFGVTSKVEQISFPNYKSYLDIDVYHKLTLDSVKIYTNQSEVTYKEAYLTIPDYFGIFPYISHKSYNITIPIKLIQDGEYWTFAYKNAMYVHPKTCQMSLNPRDGFVTTNSFYLPVNQKNMLIDQNIKIHIEDFGVGLTDINWSLEYIAQLSLVGDCDESEYCVVGERI